VRERERERERESGLSTSCRFVRQVQWERWRAKRKLCPGPSIADFSVGVWGYKPRKILRLYMQNTEIYCSLGRKELNNDVHNAFLDTLTMVTALYHAFALEMTPAV